MNRSPDRLRRSPALAAAAGILGLLMQPAQASPRTLSVIDANGQPLAGAVVAVELAGARPARAEGAQAEMAQRQRQFVPNVLVVQTGTAVSFPNFDSVRHHVYSFSPTKAFELKLYAGTPAAPVLFDKAGVAVLGCNIHDKMTAWVVVVDTPLYAKTGADGRASLDLPDGEHKVKLWHPSLQETMQEQPLRASEQALTLRLTAARR